MNFPSRTRSALLATAVAVTGLAGLATETAHAVRAGGLDTAFAIRRSSSRNRVDYGVRLDEACRPRGDEPVVPYHRRLARGPNVVDDLSLLERTAYGVRSQRVTRAENGGSVELRLRAVPDRRIRVVVQSEDGGACGVTPYTRVGGVDAELVDVFIVLDGPRDVNRIELTGRTSDGRTVREALRR